MRKTLTDVLVRGAKPPGTGRLELTDERCSGLAFRVTAGGVRTWCFRFRDPRSGKTTRATIGTYPDVSLARARERAEDLRREVADGSNPVARKRQERAEAPTKTFQALANRYLDEHARRFKRSADADERNLRLHVLPEWSDRPYDEIARRDVISLVEKLVTVGKPVLANRVQALVSSIYSFALDADLVDRNPAARLRKRGVETTRTRVLSDDELRMFWKRSVLPPVSKPVGLALRLCLSTGMRAGEVAGLARRELVFLEDPIRAAALIPGDRVKNGQACYVPFATLALDTIREAIRMAGDKNDHVFPSRTSDGPIDGHALAVAMSRLADVVPDGLPGVQRPGKRVRQHHTICGGHVQPDWQASVSRVKTCPQFCIISERTSRAVFTTITNVPRKSGLLWSCGLPHFVAYWNAAALPKSSRRIGKRRRCLS